MAAISVKESDFAVLASAAMEAKDREDLVEAVALDILARRVNAAISNSKLVRLPGMPDVPGLKWSEVKSILDYPFMDARRVSTQTL